MYDQYFRSGVSPRIQYKNPEFDKLIDEEQKTGDPKKRIALLQQAGRILMEDVPFVPLYTLAEIYGVARNVIWKARPDEKVLSCGNEDPLETVRVLLMQHKLAELLVPANFLQAITLLPNARPYALLRDRLFHDRSFSSDDFVTQTHIFARETQRSSTNTSYLPHGSLAQSLLSNVAYDE